MKNNKGLKWLATFFLTTIAAAVILMLICYIVDPFFAYRVRDNTYMVSESNSLPGIIKNDEYDSLLIGSSMTQNFKMEDFKEKLNLDTAKISTAGMVLNDVINLTNLADRKGKAKKYYICLDLPRFLNDGMKERVPKYLIDDNLFNDYKYLLGYSTWIRYIPIDIAFIAADKLGISLGEDVNNQKKIDEIGYWGDTSKFGKDIVINNYLKKKDQLSEVVSNDHYKDIVKKTDLLVECFDKENVEYNCFLPPYSILYWCYTEEKGYFEELVNGKKYLVKKLKEKGCNVYDFQVSEDVILNLDNYKDITHYSAPVNKWMVDCFSNKEFLCDENDIEKNSNKIIQMVEDFKKNNKELFSK